MSIPLVTANKERAFAEKYKFSVNEQFTGHGIGRNFHQPPWILHYRQFSSFHFLYLALPGGADGEGNSEEGIMQPGDCFTIEPALVQGSDSRGDTWDDGWTMGTLVCHPSQSFCDVNRD
jgi:methionyl aminopeptidase